MGSHSFLQGIFPTQGLNWVSRTAEVWATREAPRKQYKQQNDNELIKKNMERNLSLKLQICGAARLGDCYSQWKVFFCSPDGFLLGPYMWQGLLSETGSTSCGLFIKKYTEPQAEGEAAWEVTCLRGLQTDLRQFLGSAEGVVVMGGGNKSVGLHPGSALRFCLSSFDLFYTMRRVFRFSLNEAFLCFIWSRPWPNIVP